MLSGLGEGSYSVLVSDDSGCSVEIGDINVLTGLRDVTQMALSTFPNPASSKLFCLGILPGDAWSLMTLNGAEVRQGLSCTAGLALDVSSLEAGMYLLVVTRQGVRQVQKVQVQH